MPRKSPVDDPFTGEVAVVLGAGALRNVGMPLYKGMSAVITALEKDDRAREKVQAGRDLKERLMA